MTMLGQSSLQKLVKGILSKSEADETEVLFLGLEEALTRFANNEIHQNVAETNFGLIIRTAVGKRVGAISTTDTSESGIDHALEQVIEITRLQPESPDFPGFAPPVADQHGLTAYDESTAEATPEFRARSVGSIIDYAVAHDVNCSGAFRTGRYEWVVANSHDLFVYTPLTLSDLVVVAMTDTSSGYAEDASWRVGRIDVAARGQQAVNKAIKAQNPQPIPYGEFPVVLEPYAAADIVTFIGRSASALSVHEGRSWMSGRQGNPLLSEKITVDDVPQDPCLWPIPYDFEGVPRQSVTIIKQGVVGDAVYDRTWGKKVGKASTGHGLPPFNPFSPGTVMRGSGPVPLHLNMKTGAATVDDMVKGIKRGLYVTRFNYTREVHPREVVITGLTRDGTFLIENGEITTPVHNLRFTQSYIQALKSVIAVGNRSDTSRGYFGVRRAPALCLGSFRFTGATQF
jgi:predicted Zn-dependent protease